MDPIVFDGYALRQLLREGAISSSAVVERLIERTGANRELNGYVEFDPDALRAQALNADARIRAGQDLPLLGVPIALKDNIDAAGFPCGAGTASLHGTHPPRDAEIVRRLRAAGALITGKVGMHELAFGITSNNAVTGAVRNPWDLARIPGGSSGGSGCVVAAGLVPMAIGTDTGGSVRVPAALCGVAGFRPSVGRYPGTGIAPISATRDTAGPIARSVRDCLLIDQVLTEEQGGMQEVGLGGLRLGLPAQHFWADLDPGVAQTARDAIETLRTAGAVFVEVDVAGVAEASTAAGFTIALFEFVRDMRAYLRESRREVGFEQLVAAIRNSDVAAIASPLIAGGAISQEAYEGALDRRVELQRLYADAFEKSGVDAMVFPTTPRTASLIGEDDTVDLNGHPSPTFPTFIRNTDPGSNAGIPGVTVPAGLSRGLPVGLALDGPLNADRRLLGVAAAVESALPAAAVPAISG